MASSSTANILDDPMAYLAPGATSVSSRPDVGTETASDDALWTGSGEFIASWGAKVSSSALPALPLPALPFATLPSARCVSPGCPWSTSWSVSQARLRNGLLQTVPITLKKDDIELEFFPALSSCEGQWKGGLWWGSASLWTDPERQDMVKVWRDALKKDVLPDKQFVFLPAGAFSLTGRQRFLDWILQEHNAGRLPGFVTKGGLRHGFPGPIAPSLLMLRRNLDVLLGELCNSFLRTYARAECVCN